MVEPQRVVLGIDAGTTSVKTVAFAPDGAMAAVARSTLHVQRGARGEAELDMNQVWEATASTLTAVVEQLNGAEVVGIGITGQGDGLWLVDGDGVPIGNAALWMDGRADARTAAWEADGRSEVVHRITGSRPFAGAFPVLLEMAVAATPGLFGRLGHHLNCKDWLGFRLTGVIATDPSEGSRTYLDLATGEYSDDLLARLGQEPVRAALPPVHIPGTVLGLVTERVAAELGLRPGIPVVTALVDVATAGVGLGVTGNGHGYLILGTTGVVAINHERSAEVRSGASLVVRTGRGDQVLEALAPMTGTPNLDWVRQTLGFGDATWDELEVKAAAVPPGCAGILYLPYGSPSGERAPFIDSSASAAWLGMSVSTGPDELLRSVYEGLAFSLTECIETLGLIGPLTICGGGSESDLFCSILADVSDATINRQNAPEVGARGAAYLAASAVGLFPNLQTAIAAMSPASVVFEPDPSRHEHYRAVYATFVETRDSLRLQWPALRKLRHHPVA
jgi:xylulokinase